MPSNNVSTLSVLSSGMGREVIAAYMSSSGMFFPKISRAVSAKKFFRMVNEYPPHSSAPAIIYPPPGNGRVSSVGISKYPGEYTEIWLLVPTVICTSVSRSLTDPMNAAWLSPMAEYTGIFL